MNYKRGIKIVITAWNSSIGYRGNFSYIVCISLFWFSFYQIIPLLNYCFFEYLLHIQRSPKYCWVSFDVFSARINFILFKRGTELLPGLIFAKINFFIFRDMVKSLEYDVFTIIISNFDYKVFVFNSKT